MKKLQFNRCEVRKVIRTEEQEMLQDKLRMEYENYTFYNRLCTGKTTEQVEQDLFDVFNTIVTRGSKNLMDINVYRKGQKVSNFTITRVHNVRFPYGSREDAYIELVVE